MIDKLGYITFLNTVHNTVAWVPMGGSIFIRNWVTNFNNALFKSWH